MSSDACIGELVGKKILRIFMNEEWLKFETNVGDISFRVEGDCCSTSYFHDFIGLDKLRNNGPVISASEIRLDEVNGNGESTLKDGVIAYGFELVTEDPEFGEVTSVFSFRNESNGYYGGYMTLEESAPDDLPELIGDAFLGNEG